MSEETVSCWRNHVVDAFLLRIGHVAVGVHS